MHTYFRDILADAAPRLFGHARYATLCHYRHAAISSPYFSPQHEDATHFRIGELPHTPLHITERDADYRIRGHVPLARRQARMMTA